MGRSDLEAIATLLGDRPFFATDRPTTIDTVAYGCLANILLVPIETELKRIAARFPNLLAWTDAMDRRFA
jgi:glutathione S-transferase